MRVKVNSLTLLFFLWSISYKTIILRIRHNKTPFAYPLTKLRFAITET